MKLPEIEKLVALLKDTDITEIEFEEGTAENPGSYVRISRGHVAHHAAPVVQHQPATVQQTQEVKAIESHTPKSHQVTENAPMVGTFYRSSGPSAAPFVKVGDKVKEGDTLCIIEAMKMMNQIEATKAGTIKAILVEDAHPVEFGTPLFVIE
jgi:acetyl-CoA carboxylase biotin carboxyl carrier protein